MFLLLSLVTGFTFHTAVLSVLSVMFQIQLSFVVNLLTVSLVCQIFT